MASTGKKGKKNKGTVISLQSFLSNGVGSPVGTTQVTKKVRNMEADDSDDSSTTTTQIYQLPTAPRANRVLDDSSIPQNPPFLAFITNLPFDIQENDFQELFVNVNISSVRIPRDDSEGGRIRGFGYVEFDSRDDLIYVLSLPDPQIKGRRIRIDVSNGNEPSAFRLKSNRRAYDGFGNNEGRDSSNWRENSKNDDINVISSKSTDRSINRDGSHISDDVTISWRSNKNSVHKSQVVIRNELMSSKERCSDSSRRRVIHDQVLERPKLNLKPRSLPLPSSGKETDVESIEKSNEMSNKSINDSAKKISVDEKDLEPGEKSRIIEVKRNEKTQRRSEQKDLQTNGNHFDIGGKDYTKQSQNCTLTNWRNSVNIKSVRKNQIDSHILPSGYGTQEHESVLPLKNSYRIEQPCNNITSPENEGNAIKMKNVQSESIFKSSNKFSELDEE